MIENPLFITIHGIDGTGKTTTTDKLTRSFDAAGVRAINYDLYESEKIKNPFSSAKKRVVNETSPSAQLAYYLGSTLFHCSEIEGLLDEGYSVVKSRYIDDVLAHHAELRVPNTREITKLFPIVQPDLRVILTLDEELRRERITKRGKSNAKDKEVRSPGSRLDFFENYLLTINSELISIGKAIRIDTTHLDPQQVAEQIISHLLTTNLLQPEGEHE